MSDSDPRREILVAIERLEAQREALGDEAVEIALAALRARLEAGAPSGRAADAREAGERKLVTILFADISGFTPLAAKLDPEQVRSLINRCFDRLVPAVEAYEGTIDKFVGDAIVALFGAPVAHEDDAERALRAALAMRQALERFNAESGTELELHFGVNTGTVVAGHIGSHDRQDYSVMGDAVNVAARLEDLSGPGEVLVGPDTHRLTAEAFEFAPLPPAVIKGKPDPMPVFRLLQPREHRPRASRMDRPLVGRRGELARLERALVVLSGEAPVSGSSGARIAVAGEAGLGKSRLIAEVRRSRSRSIAWAEGRALAHTQGESYGVARELLRDLVLDDGGDDPGEALERAVRRALSERVEDVVPYLRYLLEAPLDERQAERVRYLGGDVLRRRVVAAYREFIRARAFVEPLVLVWEDLHWSDASSLEVLKGLFPIADECRLLLLLAFRPEPCRFLDLHGELTTRWGDGYATLELEPLTESESARLVEESLRGEGLPAAIRGRILARAEGNPFFLEELLRDLVDAGRLVLRDGRVVAARRLDTFTVPDTVQGVIAARIDRLPSADKRTLQTAAVVGRIFHRDVLEHLRDEIRSRSLDGSLDTLERREFVRRREGAADVPADGDYIFKHVITQEVGYSTLLISRRRELHLRVAEALERLFPDRLEELAGPLGFHFRRAEEHRRAAEYLIRAAHRARGAFANEEALAHYAAAREEVASILASGPEDRPLWQRLSVEIDEGRGDVLARTGRNAEAREAFAAGLALLPPEDRISRSRLLRRIGNAWFGERRFQEGLGSFEDAVRTLGAEARETEDGRREWNELGLDRVWGFYWMGEWPSILELVEELRPSIIERGTAIERARLYQAVALALMRRDRFTATPETVASARASYEAGEASGNPAQAAHGRFSVGFVHFFARELPEAERFLASGLELSRRIGEVTVESRCLTYLAAVNRMAGRAAELERLAGELRELAAEYGMIEYQAAAAGHFAWLAWRRGDAEQALEEGRRALELWAGWPSPARYPFEWFARWPLMAVAAAGQDAAAATEHAAALLDTSQQPPPDEIASRLESIVAASGGQDPAGAIRAAAAAVRSAAELGWF